MKGYVYWSQTTPDSDVCYYVAIASSQARANRAFYNFVRGTLGRVYDACFRPCDELTLPFDDEFFNDGEIWDLQGLMRNYRYEC